MKRNLAIGAFCTLLAGVCPAQIGGHNWKAQPVTFNVQWPYNVPETNRYTLSNGVYHCWVYSNDVPFKVGSTTLPRTEQRFTPDYTNGEIQYQATLMAPSNENSYSLFQIHTGDAQSSQYGSTTFMLFWFSSNGGSVHDYSGTELARNLGNQWFQLNVDHNLVTRTIKVWINAILVWTQQDNGAGDFYFKDGVYMQSHGATYQMDAWIKNSIQIWTSPGTNSAPVIGGSFLEAGNFVLSGSGGIPGVACTVLESTNVGLPLPNWRVLASNVFDASGSLVFTNAIEQGTSQQYYRLQTSN